MLDIRLIREDPAAVERALATRGAAISLSPVLAADAERRRLLTETEELKAERNRASEAIGQAKRRGEDAQAVTARMREVSDRIKALDLQVKDADARLETPQRFNGPMSANLDRESNRHIQDEHGGDGGCVGHIAGQRGNDECADEQERDDTPELRQQNTPARD